MPIFYFNVKNGDQVIVDEEGSNLGDLSAARNEALLSAREILASVIAEGKSSAPESIVVTDTSGTVVDTISFTAVLPPNLRLMIPGEY
jgi:hypothetical protein